MRKIWIIGLICLAAAASAQEHSMTLGLHGGVFNVRVKNGSWGPLAGAELRYQCLFRINSTVRMGYAFGVDAAFGSIHYQTSMENTFMRWDNSAPKHEVQYTMTGEYLESFKELRIQVPILWTMRTRNGFVMGLGVGCDVWKQMSYREQWIDSHVCAYYPHVDVTIVDADPAGLLVEDDYRRSLGMGNLEWSIIALAEIGHEWQLRSKNAIGLELFGNYAVLGSAVPVLEVGLKGYFRFTVSNSGPYWQQSWYY